MHIERRKDKFVLTDVSTNGTYVTIEGDKEIELDREQFTFSKRGWITFGEPCVHAKDGRRVLPRASTGPARARGSTSS